MTRKWEALKQRIASENSTKIRMGMNKEASLAALMAGVLGEPSGTPTDNTWPTGSERSVRNTWANRLVELADMVYGRIMQWDIRCAGKLLECFPDYLPKTTRGIAPVAEMDEKGDWVLVWESARVD